MDGSVSSPAPPAPSSSEDDKGAVEPASSLTRLAPAPLFSSSLSSEDGEKGVELANGRKRQAAAAFSLVVEPASFSVRLAPAPPFSSSFSSEDGERGVELQLAPTALDRRTELLERQAQVKALLAQSSAWRDRRRRFWPAGTGRDRRAPMKRTRRPANASFVPPVASDSFGYLSYRNTK